MARKLVLLSLLPIFVFPLSSCFSGGADEWRSYSRHLRQAEEFQRQEHYEDAIKAYRGHIQARLNSEDRPEWENPYFYHLLIGDLYLKQEKVEEALSEYEFAQIKGVAPGLVSDRYRLVANWLADQGRFEEAIALLNDYRSSDPLLYDLMRDRLARMLVEQEEANLNCEEGQECPVRPSAERNP